ncbi:hypothetical protein [Nocardia sp. 348MFTsu5.1]|uniref:hypothetical protein n=1 Tax=Nocardia sp. 348MFTsu5.1 TaxID=1172185 RepID=UPI0018CBB2E8|nr:hypothetical protein [Nocardia sp. 348MFTsu5.1]
MAATVAAASMAAAISMGGVLAGSAWADPEQGGVTTEEPTPEQGGVSPAPAPAPEPSPAPAPDYGPGILPSPTQEAAPVVWTEPPSGPPAAPYDPTPPSGFHPPVPTAPVAPKLPPEGKIRVGNFVTDRPAEISPEVAVSINEYSAYGEAKLAQFFQSVGFTEDEASRRAASAILGAAIGGAAGAVAFGVPTMIAVGLFTVPIGGAVGAAIGSVVPPTPFNTGPGLLIGLGAGAGVAAGAGAIAAVAGGTLGAVLGGALGYALGAGDPNANPTAPWEHTPAPAPEPAPLPNPGANQYELVLDSAQAADAGLPAADYTVTTVGDVNLAANAGGQQINVGWTAEQANAPFAALGPLEQPAKDLTASLTKQAGDGLTQIVDGLQITYPQTIPAPAAQ